MNKHVHVDSLIDLVVEGVWIPKSDQITCLGSVISGSLNEKPAYEHRIAKGWKCYHKWSRVLESNAPLPSRLLFWAKTVLPSLLWGLQTTRSQNKASAYHKLLFAQKLQIRKMMGSKRKINDEGAAEKWLDYHIRTLRKALDVINDAGLNIHCKLQNLKESWAGHIARFGNEGKDPHLLKSLIAFRCNAWWGHQSFYNKVGWQVIKHAPQLGRPKRWEGQFPADWWLSLAGPLT